jgi:hypothetical protein
MSDKRPKRLLTGFFVFLVVILTLPGCNFISRLLGLSKEEAPKQDQTSTTATISSLIGGMAKSLSSKLLCTVTEASAIAEAANSAVQVAISQLANVDLSLFGTAQAARAQLTNFDALIPVAVGGAV